MKNFIVFLLFSVGLALPLALSKDSHLGLPLQVSTLAVTPHQPNSNMERYALSMFSFGDKIGVGVRKMSWQGSANTINPTGWRSSVEFSKEGRPSILIQIFDKQWIWFLELTVIQIGPSFEAISISSPIEWESSNAYFSTNRHLNLLKVQNNIKIDENIQVLILLNGIKLSQAKLEREALIVDLSYFKWSMNGITLQQQIKGLQRLFYTIVIYQVEELLKHHISLDISQSFETLASEKQVKQMLIVTSFFGLTKQVDSLTDNQAGIKANWIENQEWSTITLSKIKCRGFWSIDDKICLNYCKHQVQIGDLKVCYDTDRFDRLLDSHSSWGSTTTIVPCPSSITNCIQCQKNYGSSTTVCEECIAVYYITSSGNCQPCPFACTSCQYMTRRIVHVHCYTCLPTFHRNEQAVHNCICGTNQYINYTVPECTPCHTGCSSCTDNVTCTSCSQGYYLSGSSCLACMPVCKTCTTGAACSSCINNLQVSGSSCICPSPKLLDPVTVTCILCQTFDPNCLSCAYNPSFDPINPNPLKCTTPALTYYIQANGTTAPCGANCDVCTSNTVCTTCSPTFSTSNGSCVCSPLFLTNAAPQYCQNCSVIVPGCNICQTTATTQCQVCLSTYYSPTNSTPTPTCLPCPLTCASCESDTVCYTCDLPFTMIGSMCLCSGLTYVDSTQTACQTCSSIIMDCSTCNDTLPTTCISCVTGFSPSNDQSSCIACPLNCGDCSSNTVCITCNLGYNWNGTVCDCDSTCQNCLTITTGSCSACVDALNCLGCAAGWYFTNPTCTPCMPECQACSNGISCLSCDSPFILNAVRLCVCNNTAGDYLSLNGSTCQPCSVVKTNCSSCIAIPTTNCSACTVGFFLQPVNNTCQPCIYPCASCSLSTTDCDSCVSTYTHDPVNYLCYCDNSTQLFYSFVTDGCLACSSLLENCASCFSNATNETQCTVCSDPYYVDLTTNKSCLLCDIRCTSCTAIDNCSSCATNLVNNGTFCVCDTASDPSLAYYQPTNMCVSCLGMISNCLICSSQPLTCSSCASGTYINGSVCMACPSECDTCDITGCLTCPLGTTPSGSSCVCSTSCQSCQVTSVNCLSCTLDPSDTVTSCASCLPGFYVATDGVSCATCPDGCVTCSSSSVCTTCLDTFILVGTTCQCSAALNLYRNGGICQLCEDIFYGCSQCSTTGTTTSCTACADGMFLNGTICSYCSSSCLTCSGQITCTSCPTGLTLSGSNCICGSDCTNCSSNISACTTCLYTILGSFSQCTSCQPTFYLDDSNICQSCPAPCITCDSTLACTSCSATLQVIGGSCSCDASKSMIMNTVTNLCQSCTASYPHCKICQANASVLSLGYDCALCDLGHYYVNSTCEEQICGDGIVSPSQQCDDGNNLNMDGCYACYIQEFYQCTGQPSVCLAATDITIAYDSVEVSSTICNELTLFFRITPVYDSYSGADFNLMYQTTNATQFLLKKQSFFYSSGVIGYTFEYTADVVGKYIKILFMPKFLEISETSQVPLYPIIFEIGQSLNGVALIYQNPSVCEKKEKINKYIDFVQYSSFGVLILSALPAKIVGLELFGVLQLTFLSLGSIDHLNPLQASLTKLSSSNGLNLKIDDKEPTNSRRLQSSARTSSRVQTIGYASNFLRNCNLMFMLVGLAMVISFVLYLLTCCLKSCTCLYGLTRRLLKELLLTLILFNCFNFAYCAGLHFSYADPNDSLYVLGTVAAICAILIPLMMIGVLQCTEEVGFGQYKDKLKAGRVEKAYFMVTILYRMGIGFYMASMNQQIISTLIVLLLSIYFIIYNLVNLPFRKAYHNYRANICHLSQFGILFVAMFYRSMNDGASMYQLDQLYDPVYFELFALGLCLLVSGIVLVIEICVWIGEMREHCQEKETMNKVSQEKTQDNQVQVENKENNYNVSSEQLAIFETFAQC